MKPWSTICLLVALGGCDRSVYSDWSRERTAETADIARVNSANGLARISELQDRVDQLERKIDQLESSEDVNKSNISELFEKAGPSVNDWQNQQIDRLYENDRKLAARTGLPVN